jgi:hypothetical protein
VHLPCASNIFPHVSYLCRARIGSSLFEFVEKHLTESCREVATSHIKYLIEWFVSEVDPDNSGEVRWIDVHRISKLLVEQISILSQYVHSLKSCQ